MPKKFLLTAFSKDRPGIVADLSRIIYENGYNLEESSMTNLAGEFAILLLLSTPATNGDDVQEKLSLECRRLEREKGITAFIRPISQKKQERKTNILTKTIHVEGLDQAGIVYKVSQFFADNDINISTLNTEMKLSPESGAAIYAMTIVVELPSHLSLQTVEDGLGQIGDQLNVDVSID
jgi:glycine cleavage system transcriptional repressor